MTKREFLNELADKLSEGMTREEIMSQLQYYAGYIDGEIARGKTEEEATEDLGEPILIARTILESPRDEESIFGHVIQNEEDAYFEGTYQGRHQVSTAEIKAAMKEDVPIGEASKEAVKSEEEREARIEAEEKSEEKETSVSKAEESVPDEQTEEKALKETGKGFMVNENGEFRWDLLAAALVGVLALTAVIYVALQVLSFLGPVIVGILVVAFIVFFIYRSKKS